MPYRRKKSYRRRRRKKYQIHRPLLGNSFVTSLKYFEEGPINPVTTGTSVWVFSANGLYDPNVTYTGHQPRGFDQLMPLYDHYVVIGSKCHVKLCTQNPGELPVTCTLALRDSATSETTPIDYIEGRNCKFTLLPPAETHQLTMNYSPKKFFSIKDVMADDEQQGTISSMPAEQAYYHLSLTTASGDEVGPICCSWYIEYIVKFIEPKQPAQS